MPRVQPAPSFFSRSLAVRSLEDTWTLPAPCPSLAFIYVGITTESKGDVGSAQKKQGLQRGLPLFSLRTSEPLTLLVHFAV